MNDLSEKDRKRAAARLANDSQVMPNGCIEWRGCLSIKGYGRMSIGKKTSGAHRISWIVAHGAIPQSQFVLHRCDNRKCHNVDHLFLGTLADNMADMVCKGRAAHGERTNKTKITAEKALEIFHSVGRASEIATRMGVNRWMVRDIKIGFSWTHVTGMQPLRRKSPTK